MSSSGLPCGKSRPGAHPWCAPPSRRGPLPVPLRGSPRFSLVPPSVALAAISPTTPDSSRFPGSKGGALRSLRGGMVFGDVRGPGPQKKPGPRTWSLWVGLLVSLLVPVGLPGAGLGKPAADHVADRKVGDVAPRRIGPEAVVHDRRGDQHA